jgi:hypothetical protein
VTDGLQTGGVAASVDDAPASVPPAAADSGGSPRRPRWPGALSAAIAVLMVVTWGVGLAVSTAGMLTPGVWLSVAANALTVPAVVLGLIAVITGRGRGWGVVGIAVGILLNPVVLLYGLTWIGAL